MFFGGLITILLPHFVTEAILIDVPLLQENGQPILQENNDEIFVEFQAPGTILVQENGQEILQENGDLIYLE